MITHRSVTTALVTILWMASVRGSSAQLLPASGQSPQGAIRILPVEVSEHIVSLPSFIHSAVPELSRVGVEVVVAPTGVVVSAMPVSGSQQWYEKAAALAMTWRFTPFEREGKAAVEDGVAAFGKPPIETDRRADAVWTDTASDRQRTGADHISSTGIAFAVR